MPFELWQALLAGFAGTVAMTALMRASIAVGMTSMPPMPLIQGAMFTDDPDRAQKSGMVMEMMGQTHPRMEAAANFTGGESWRHDAEGLHIARPGVFAANYGPATPMGLLMAHAVFGLVVGAVYAALV